MILLLDSTALIGTLRGDRSALRELATAGHTFATSAANVAEVYAGMRPMEAERITGLFQAIDCYPVTEAIGRQAGLLVSTWARRGRTLSTIDMIVAATALEYGLTLMTANRRDFPMPELNFYPPESN